MTDRFSVAKALQLVDESEDHTYGIALEHGTMELGYYKPDGADPQQPHDQDEIYIIQSGAGFFVCGDDRKPFEPGEALFVPAGVVHRFEDFSDDFSAWVIFYGPSGGEGE